MSRSMTLLFALASMGSLAGCLDMGGGGGSAGEGAGGGAERQACPSGTARLDGLVSYWAPAGSPDSVPADGVDVLLSQGGPVWRVRTSLDGTFSVEVSVGKWELAPDVYTGCESESSTIVDVEACDRADVELVISNCAQ